MLVRGKHISKDDYIQLKLLNCDKRVLVHKNRQIFRPQLYQPSFLGTIMWCSCISHCDISVIPQLCGIIAKILWYHMWNHRQQRDTSYVKLVSFFPHHIMIPHVISCLDVIQILLPAWRALKKNSFSPFDTQVPSQRTLVLNIVNSFKADDWYASSSWQLHGSCWFPPSRSEQDTRSDTCRVGHHSVKASNGR